MTTPLITHRSFVNTWECDQMGHMNVQFYVEKADDALAHFAADIGVTPARVREGGRGLALREDHIRFTREIRAGETVTIRTGAVEVGETGMRLYSEMIALGSGEVSASFDMLIDHVEPPGRRLRPLDDAVRANASSRIDEEAAPARPFGPLAPGPETEDMFETYRGAVHGWECDASGFMTPRFHIARFSDAAGHLFQALGMAPARMRESGWGTAALDYRTRYLRPPVAGDVLAVKTGVLEVRDKTLRVRHRLLDAAGDTTFAEIEIVAVLFDLERRKSVPLPAGLRRNAERLRIG